MNLPTACLYLTGALIATMALSRYHQIKQQRPVGIYRQEFCPLDEGVQE